MRWERVWVVTAVGDGPDGRREKIAHTVAELRALLTAARADPAVWHVRHESRRQLAGDLSDTCPAGHPLRTRGTLATPHDWWDCLCGGHWWLYCRTCGREVLDPTLVYDCRPRRPDPQPR